MENATHLQGCFRARAWVGTSAFKPFTCCHFSVCQALLWSSQPGVLGASLSGASLNSWGTQSGVQALTAQGQDPGFEFPNVDHCARDGVYGKKVSLPLLPTSLWSPSTHLMPRCLSAIFNFLDFFFPEEIISYSGVHLVCLWEEVSSASSYIDIFNWNPPSTLLRFILK